MSYTSRVVFVQKFVPHYRLPFFEKFKSELARHNIDFLLVYGAPDPFEGSKVKVAFPEWGCKVNSRIFNVKGRYLYWQHVYKHLKKGDLVITEHAAKLLDNYLIYALSRLGFIKMGYFGHGENFLSGNELAVSRTVKKAMLAKVAQWFAYTEVARTSLLSQGVDDTIITVVNNTLTNPETQFSKTEKVNSQFVYIGGLYADKRIDQLLESADIVASQHPPFQLHIVGDGPLREQVEEKAKRVPWLHYHGSLYGEQRNKVLAESQAILIPGAVGLVAIDSFHFKCPIITTQSKAHGPEIAYLENHVNALFNKENGDAKSFADLTLTFIQTPNLANELQRACEACRDTYTLDNMVTRFVAGVQAVQQEAK